MGLVSVLVCDDVEKDRVMLGQMVERYGQRCNVDIKVELLPNGIAVQRLWQPRRWDVAFLDIYMPELTGDKLARWLWERDRDCALIFATTSELHGMTGFELGVADYLVKPIAQADVDEAMGWVLRTRAWNLRTLPVHTDWEQTEIRLRDIRFLEVRHNTTWLHAGGSAIPVRRGLDSVAAEIGPEEHLFRCHRSFLVNLAYVDRIEGQDFLLDGGERVPISGSRLAQARRVLQEYELKAGWETETNDYKKR